jgi:hypothetical protein
VAGLKPRRRFLRLLLTRRLMPQMQFLERPAPQRAGRLEGPRMPLPPPEQETTYRSGFGPPETRYSG